MRTILSTDTRAIERLATRDEARRPAVERLAARIVRDVRRRGDAAVASWERKLSVAAQGSRAYLRGSHASTPDFLATPTLISDFRPYWRQTPPELRRAITQAADHIRAVAERQVPRGFVVRPAPGIRIEQRVQPLARVGCYVPGGRHPLPSTVLMTAIPARAAGVREIVIACPRPTMAVLAAAYAAGATAVIRMGGAQAIAALAYGTESIARVDKIVGPGNAWVTAAKALVSHDCPIEFRAGPSEIVVCADAGDPEWIARDLIAQAEHDPAARAIFVTTTRALAAAVDRAVTAAVPAAGPAREALRRQGAIVLARTRPEAIDIVNRLAPEHLVCDRASDVGRFTAAGTIFVGAWSAQASGDYATGSNHVLPTGGAARFRGGLTAADFVRVFTVQTLTERGLRAIASSVVTLAEAEGLEAHAESVRVRVRARATARGADPRT